MTNEDYDFSGWATRNDLKCSDGRVIRRNAFKDNDGMTVPLVWNHQHNEASNVLGHALLENRSNGVYAYCTFNDTENGQIAKSLVQHKDVNGLSIYANKLKQIGSDVLHGAIREVSLVLAGANPGALIETVIEHSEDSDEEAILYNGLSELSLDHSEDFDDEDYLDEDYSDEDDSDEDYSYNEEILDSMNDDQRQTVYDLAAIAAGETPDVYHSDDYEELDYEEVIDTMDDDQKELLFEVVEKASELNDSEEYY